MFALDKSAEKLNRTVQRRKKQFYYNILRQAIGNISLNCSHIDT